MRSALRAQLERDYGDDGSLILNELGLLEGATRVDVAVINGELSGYEIKSAADTLKRLSHQQKLYSQVLDRAWLVSTPGRVEMLKRELPEWWGLIAASGDPVALTIVREASLNKDPDPLAIAQLLWRDEALGLLSAVGADKGVRSKPRRVLWALLTRAYDLDTLRAAVREALRNRPNWRAGRQRSRRGGKSPLGARFLASLEESLPPRNERCKDLLG